MMVRLKLGLMKRESISWRTLSPLVTWRSPRTTLLAIVLRLIAASPASLWRALIAGWAGRAAPAKLKQLGFATLTGKTFLERYAALQRISILDSAGSFL